MHDRDLERDIPVIDASVIIWADKRSCNHGMAAFFGVHLVLTVVSPTLATIIGVFGIRALCGLCSSARATAVAEEVGTGSLR